MQNSTTTPWIPLLASAMLEPNEVVQVFVSGTEVAVWSSAAAQIQVWENRCPHRSVRFSLGRVEGESLVCAYHGWRFAAANAACQRIPAQPDQRAPASLCARAYGVCVQDGMIWFAGVDLQPAHPVSAHDIAYGSAAQTQLFCGSVVIHASLADISSVLNSKGFVSCADNTNASDLSYCWHKTDVTTRLRIYITPHNSQRATLHMMLSPIAAQYELPDIQHMRLSAMQLLYSMRDKATSPRLTATDEYHSHAEA